MDNSLPATLQQIPLDQIQASPYQARRDFNPEGIKSLAGSIKGEGLLQPVLLRRLAKGYELVAGERRVRAVTLLGWSSIEAKVIDTASEANAAKKGLIENLHRENLNPMEEAEGLLTLKRLDPSLVQEELAKIVGKSQTYVTTTMRLLKLPEQIRGFISQLIIGKEHAVELLRLDDSKLQIAAADQIVAKGLSLLGTRALVNKMLKVKKGALGGRPAADPFAELWPELYPRATWVPWQESFKKGQWFFAVNSIRNPTLQTMAEWFTEMGKLMAFKVANPGVEIPASLPAKVVLTHQLRGVARLPQTPAEHAELEKLANSSSGPGPVYEWIYGPKSTLTAMMQPQTWLGMGASSPKQGLEMILEGIRQFQEIEPNLLASQQVPTQASAHPADAEVTPEELERIIQAELAKGKII